MQLVLLSLQLSADYLIGEWRSPLPFEYSYEVYEAFHEITSDFLGRSVRHNILRRKIFNSEKLQIADEFIFENRAIMMYQPLLTQTSYHSVI